MARRAVVRGRVQGVGYRLFALRGAQQLGLNGWVRNLPDGSVETFAEGEEAAMEATGHACRGGTAWRSSRPSRRA